MPAYHLAALSCKDSLPNRSLEAFDPPFHSSPWVAERAEREAGKIHNGSQSHLWMEGLVKNMGVAKINLPAVFRERIWVHGSLGLIRESIMEV